MQDRPEFIKDQASQRLYFEAREGRPSATPTVEIKDSGGTVLTADAATYVTQLTTDTTIATSASKGATQVTLTAVTGLEFRKSYRLVNGLSQVDWVTVNGWNATSKVVQLADPLQYDFTLDRGTNNFGDFESCGFYYTLQTADYDTLREMVQANATYVVGGLTYRVRDVYDCVITPLPNPLTAAATYQRWPDISRQEPDGQEGQDFLPQREDAWREIKRRIRQTTMEQDDRYSKRLQWRPAMVVDVSDLFEAGMAQLLVRLHAIGVAADKTNPDTERLDAAAETAWLIAKNTISWLDAEEDEAMGEGEELLLETDLIR